MNDFFYFEREWDIDLKTSIHLPKNEIHMKISVIILRYLHITVEARRDTIYMVISYRNTISLSSMEWD